MYFDFKYADIGNNLTVTLYYTPNAAYLQGGFEIFLYFCVNLLYFGVFHTAFAYFIDKKADLWYHYRCKIYVFGVYK